MTGGLVSDGRGWKWVGGLTGEGHSGILMDT